MYATHATRLWSCTFGWLTPVAVGVDCDTATCGGTWVECTKQIVTLSQRSLGPLGVVQITATYLNVPCATRNVTLTRLVASLGV